MNKSFTLTYTESQLSDVAQRLLGEFGSYPVWAFYASMGAGKTTLIKEICRILEVEETTSSPTFAIINEYHCRSGCVYHFDCYRLQTLADAHAIGAEEYLYSGEYCFVEWPEVIEGILPEGSVKIVIDVQDPSTRILSAAKLSGEEGE